MKIYQKYLKLIKNYNIIKEKIKDIIIKTIISQQNDLINENKKIFLNDKNLFYLLGFDIIIKDDFEPILLEVNYSPSMKIYDKVDTAIKTNIFIDILNIVGISPFSHVKKYKNEFNFDKEYNDILCELARPRGDFELIFPLIDNIKKYKKYFLNNISINQRFWDKLK